MKIATALRISRDVVRGRGVRQLYWTAQEHYGRVRRLREPRNEAMAAEVQRSHRLFLLGGVRPVRGEARERAKAAVAWLLRGQAATPDDGVSLGYFPGDHGASSGWRPSYPETTGYIIPSLLDYSQRYGDTNVRASALRMARWEVEVQMPSGAVQGGPVCAPEKQSAAVFNTGMVLQGYTAVLDATGDLEVLAGARRAADFLVGDMGEDGHFRTHGPYVTPHRVKTYNCLCAWPLYRLGDYAGEDQYRRTAMRSVEAAIGEQRPNGWFAHNCLQRPEAPLLHTIGYTLQGILEVGLLAKSERCLEAVRRGVAPLLERIAPNGFLHGCFYSDWEPATWSSCLTGQAQLAVVCYRLAEVTNERRYRDQADRMVDFLKALQCLDSSDPGINGALAGSFPILGSYMSGGYPNWATKYFLDALMRQDAVAGA
jgi:hypothetical protein